MPDSNGIKKEPPDKRTFMREKVVKQPLSRQQLAVRLAIALCLAALCGAVAAISFVFTKSAASKVMGQESTEETTPIVFTKDEPDASSSEETEPPSQTSAVDEQWMQENLSKAIQEHSFTAADLSAIYGGMRSLAQELDSGIVTVHSETQQTDWFGNSVENTDQAAGAIIAKTGREILIFTSLDSISDTEAIEVVFDDGQAFPAMVKQTDQVIGTAVISVDASGMSAETVEHLKVIELGNSYSVKKGDLVLAVGSPAGIVHSTNYGCISYVARNVQVTDGVSRVFLTDMAGNADAGTFIVDIEGRMIGWVTNEFQNENLQEMTAIYSISDYKAALERMSNGRSIAYFGVKGQDVTGAMTEEGMPAGVYVADAIAGGPAYEAGIQNGDIITEINGKEISSVKDIQTRLESIESGQEILVKIRRPSRGEYKELEYHVNVRAR